MCALFYFTLDCLQSIGQRLQIIQPIHATTHRQTTNKHHWIYGQATKQQLIKHIHLVANSSSETIGNIASYNLDTETDACWDMLMDHTHTECWSTPAKE
jgi:hypothetical protein